MYEIELLDGKKIWMNERIIEQVRPNDDGTFTLYHFNDISFASCIPSYIKSISKIK